MLAGVSLRSAHATAREWALPVALWLVTAAAVGGLGYSAGLSGSKSLMGACAFFGLGLLSVDMVLLCVVALPGMLALQRIGSTLSASDLILFCAAAVALLFLRISESPELRALIWAMIAYQAALIPTLIQNRYSANLVEWLHEILLVGGALVCGWAIGRAGRARLALGLFVAPVCVLAVIVCAAAPSHHFKPFDFWIFQKNALGDFFAFAAVIAYARPRWLHWRPAVSYLVVLICALGAFAVQSRQGVISLAAGIAVFAVRGRVAGRRSRIILLAMIPLLAVAYTVTADQLNSGNKFNSAHQRLQWYGDSVDVWRHGEWLGVGLRWWYTNRFKTGFQPPNAELEMLTSAGIVGLAAFLITFGVALRVLWRMDALYGMLPFTILWVRFVQGQLDLFWVASASSLPWLVVGIALGVQSLMRQSPTPPAEETAPAAPPDRRSRPPLRPTRPALDPLGR